MFATILLFDFFCHVTQRLNGPKYKQVEQIIPIREQVKTSVIKT